MYKRFIYIWVLFILVIFSNSPYTQERPKVKIRFLDNSVKEGYVIKADDKGFDFKIEGMDFTTRFNWEELAPESRGEIRTLYLGAKPPAEVKPKEVIVPGFRIKMKDGAIFEGIIDEKISTVDTIFIKNAKRSRLIKRDEIVSQEKITLNLLDIYTPEELYKIIMDRLQPFDAEGYEKLAEELIKVGLPDRAHLAFKISEVLRRPELPEGKLYKDLLRLREMLENIAIKEMAYLAQEQYLIGEYDKALDQIDKIEKNLPQKELQVIAGEIKRIRSEINALRNISKDQQIIAEWYRTIEASLMAKAVDKNISFNDAVYYVKNQMIKEIEKIVGGRFHIDPDDPSAKVIWDKRTPTTLYKHSYDEATWLVEKPELDDKETWWGNADNNLRYKYLKGLFVEQYMSVFKVSQKNCPTCGGEGVVDKFQFPESLSGKCPSCRGLKYYRVVLYK